MMWLLNMGFAASGSTAEPEPEPPPGTIYGGARLPTEFERKRVERWLDPEKPRQKKIERRPVEHFVQFPTGVYTTVCSPIEVQYASSVGLSGDYSTDSGGLGVKHLVLELYGDPGKIALALQLGHLDDV
jgi:hypothetical protein